MKKAVKKVVRIGDIQDGDLDSFVHDLKSQEASSINNKGVAYQIDYLRSCGFTDKSIVKEVERK